MKIRGLFFVVTLASASLQDWDMNSEDQWASYKRSIIPGNWPHAM